MGGQLRSEARYAAFLSYSHKDAAEARWLHRRLESYRLPRRLVGTAGERGAVPARLVPIFRDREELPAGHDLSEKVRAALAASASLIVICSPAAAGSQWVAKEIETFRALHPDRPLFAAIVHGDPADAFPRALAALGAEPLAADLRPEGDGRRLGLLKLIAGLSGVGLDALVQRDAQRRLRRVTAITAGAITAMVIMAVTTLVALNARAEAQRQRAEAEGMVEFMLTDLRDKLREVGHLDVMQTVNERAHHYYARRKEHPRLWQETPARSARAHLADGEVYLEKGDLARARRAFHEARKSALRQLAFFPSDPRLRLDEAKSSNGLGRVHERRHEWEAAQSYYSRHADAVDPLAASALGQAAAAAINLGNVAAGQKRYAAAEPHYRKAVSLLTVARQLNQQDTHILLALANAEAWLADTFYNRHQWSSSLEHRRRQNSILSELKGREPESAEANFQYAAAERGLGCSLWKTGSREAARQRFLSAYKIAVDLARQDPEHAGWRTLKEKLSQDLLEGGFSLRPDIYAASPKGAGREEIKGCTATSKLALIAGGAP